MNLGIGLSLTVPLPSGEGGGGGGGEYTTGAVSFDGEATYLLNAALSSTDNSVLSWSFWFYMLNPLAGWNPAFVSDPANQYTNEIAFFEVDPDTSGIQWDFGNNDAYFGSTADQTTTFGTWHWAAGSGDIETLAEHLANVVIDAVDLTGTLDVVGTGGTLLMNGLPFYVGYDQLRFFNGYMADFQVWCGGSYIDWRDPANRAAVYAAGKPVDPATAATRFGAQTILLRRAPAAAASTFATNLGTGGEFAITGALTDAPSSPSD